MLRNLDNQQKQYGLNRLCVEQMNDNPLLEFQNWLDNALKNNITDANAMVLSTYCETERRPDARVVLLKQITRNGLVFFTNYQSSKGLQIAQNSLVSVTFFWAELEQQIRIVGQVHKIAAKDSDTYFNTRQTDSKIAAIVSPQSTIIPDKQQLLHDFEELKKQANLKRPLHWGGYQITPNRWEFWQGRPNRLNDRILYKKTSPTNWKKLWLAP